MTEILDIIHLSLNNQGFKWAHLSILFPSSGPFNNGEGLNLQNTTGFLVWGDRKYPKFQFQKWQYIMLQFWSFRLLFVMAHIIYLICLENRNINLLQTTVSWNLTNLK